MLVALTNLVLILAGIVTLLNGVLSLLVESLACHLPCAYLRDAGSGVIIRQPAGPSEEDPSQPQRYFHPAESLCSGYSR